jgi:hypothetical protein
VADFTIKQDDLEPGLFVTLVAPDGHAPIGLSAASIKVRVASTFTRSEIIYQDATLDDATTGDVSYSFVEGDTTVPGTYYVEFVVEWPGLRPQTYPPDGYLVLTIEPKL